MNTSNEHTYNRKVVNRNKSHVVAIPVPILKMLNIKDQDRLEYVINEKTGAIKIRKYEKTKE